MYYPSPAVHADLDSRFSYHAPIADQAARYIALRNAARVYAQAIVENTPASREQSTALTHLDAASMFANAAIARNEVTV